MKKALILLLGAMLAMVALQGCSSDKSADQSPAVIDDNVDQPVVPTDPGQIVLSQVEVGLGGGSGDDTVIGRIHQPINLTGVAPLGAYYPIDSIGLGWADVILTGDGIDPGAPYACTLYNPLSLQADCYACPNSLDPATGLPRSPDPCAANRGTFTGSAITAALTVTNNTAASGLGTCDSSALVTPLFNDAGTTCRTLDAFDVAKPIPDIDCRPNVTGGGNYCLGNLVWNGSGQGNGYCGDGVTACVEANSGGTGISTDCGAATCTSDGVTPCIVDADCPGAIAGDCVGAAPINGGDGKCWTGCGVCVPGRDLQCVAIQYTGSQPIGTATDLDALGNVKCSGGPYVATQAGIDAVENPAPGTANAWYVGNPGIAQGGSAVETISIDSTNDSYCVHTILVLEDPRGNNASPDCVAQCGDGFIANLAGEVCEPVYDMADPYAHRGCGPTSVVPTPYYCSNLPATTCTPGNELADCGDATAACGAICDVTCGACVAPAAPNCGNGVVEPGLGETCDPGAPQLDVCCNPITCTFTPLGGADPQGTCTGLAGCVNNVCDGGGACSNQNVADGTACVGNGVAECSLADTCLAGVCQNNDVAAATPCGAGVAEPTCNPDTCDGAGVCTDAPNTPDGTACPENGGGTCATGVCGAAPIIISAQPTARKGTSPGYADDANNGQTGGDPAAGVVYGILPNDPGAAVHGTDLVFFDIAIINGPLGVGDVVACDAGAAAGGNNCGVGDNACVGWAAYPEITGGGIDTLSMQCVAAGSPGIGTAVAPDEADTSTPATITCTVNGINPLSQNITMRLGFVGIRDAVVGAAPATVSPEAFVYCSNGATEVCEGTSGGAPVSAERGVATYNAYTFYDSAVFSGVAAGGGTPKGRAANGPYYGPAAADAGCGLCDTLTLSYACTPQGAGVYTHISNTVPCNGNIMFDAGSCVLTVGAPPAAGYTTIDTSAANTTFTAFTNSTPGNLIRGVDNGSFGPLPSTNVTGYIIFQ